MTEKTLVALERYLKTGSHIGTAFKTGDMQRYIFKQRKDKIKVLDVENIDSRIRIAAGFLGRFELKKIVVVSRKLYGQTPVKMFAEFTGAKALTGRFIPGTFTNPLAKEFIEPEVVLVTDPDSDAQAVSEATKIRAPVVALCSTNNYLRNVDLIIPINNKGRKSLALVYFLLAREILKIKEIIKNDTEFEKSLEDFEYKMSEEEEKEAQEKEKDENVRKKPGRRVFAYPDSRRGRKGEKRGRGKY